MTDAEKTYSLGYAAAYVAVMSQPPKSSDDRSYIEMVGVLYGTADAGRFSAYC